ncbi:hypothetical protein HNY73_002595 [Argiope bruennichi]|uniref:Uncharacterized protein n=1 Tax=Argiope bruennichi TaxID=94029 RepID=A0A8T0FVA7_ARGBR|nr:hypothetical protein HNY73_002595 [Argiope bruennichi]
MSNTKQAKLPTKNVIQGTLFATPAQLRQWAILKPTSNSTPPQPSPNSKGEVGESSSGLQNGITASIWWIKKLLLGKGKCFAYINGLLVLSLLSMFVLLVVTFYSIWFH